jgi:hypothetical protein
MRTFPPSDIHRITNPTGEVVIQLHIYGTDVGRLGTNVRRVYELLAHDSMADVPVLDRPRRRRHLRMLPDVGYAARVLAHSEDS